MDFKLGTTCPHPDVKYYTGILWEKLRKITANLLKVFCIKAKILTGQVPNKKIKGVAA